MSWAAGLSYSRHVSGKAPGEGATRSQACVLNRHSWKYPTDTLLGRENAAVHKGTVSPLASLQGIARKPKVFHCLGRKLSRNPSGPNTRLVRCKFRMDLRSGTSG